MVNKILDYNQVLQQLKKIQTMSNKIKLEEPIGTTTYGLPILHYTVGNGKNHVVLSAAHHGCEIITTDFLLNAMKEISKGNKNFEFLKDNEYTLHFLPMLNPEGYLITTSTIRKVIHEDFQDDEAQEVYNDYLEAYKKDDGECKLKLNTRTKYHQQYFGHINPYVILNRKFQNVGNQLRRIYKKANIPEGALVTWHSNGNGVDLNQNTPYNYKIQAMNAGEKIYSLLRYNNIEATSVGPIGCPMKSESFSYEPENEALMKFLLSLKHDKNISLCAYLNYHSTGGLVYHKPYHNPSEVSEGDVMPYMELEAVYNKKIAELYAHKTQYVVMDTEPTLTCFNDFLRLQIPGDILIELSQTPANPLGPYVNEAHDKTIKDNIEALAFTLEKLPELNRIKQQFIVKKSKSVLDFEDVER